MILAFVWLALLTLALAAHMLKDNAEFKKITELQNEIAELKTGYETPRAA